MNKRRTATLSSARSFVLLFVFILGSLPTTAHAVYDEQFRQSNGIYFFNSGSGDNNCTYTASATTSLDIPTLTGKDNEEKIWNYLTGQAGLSPEQAAGIMGNISQESEFNPNLEENTTRAEKGYGIVQWTFGRRTDLEDTAKKKGVEVSDLAFQLAYMVQESQGRQVSSQAAGLGYGSTSDNEWETLKKQKTSEDAAVFWHASFEISNDTADEIKERVDDAAKILGAHKDLPAGSDKLAGSAVQAGCSFAGGDLKQTLLAYAWPEYHDMSKGPVDPAPKPAYQEVVKKLQSEGKWVGGGNLTSEELGVPAGNDDNAGYGGIDCGGFVSILLTQSGFEPDYNHGLGAGSGSVGIQRAWAEEHWKSLGKGGEGFDASILQPGDVAYKDGDGHTFVYVGQVDGFESQYASASYGGYPYQNVPSWRSPMAASSTAETAALSDYTWYGKR